MINIIKVSEEDIRRQTVLVESAYQRMQDRLQKQTEDFLSKGYTIDQLEKGTRTDDDGKSEIIMRLKKNVEPK